MLSMLDAACTNTINNTATVTPVVVGHVICDVQCKITS